MKTAEEKLAELDEQRESIEILSDSTFLAGWRVVKSEIDEMIDSMNTTEAMHALRKVMKLPDILTKDFRKRHKSLANRVEAEVQHRTEVEEP